MQAYWPGTKIVRSQNNAFTSWKTDQGSVMAKDESLRRSQSATKGRSIYDPLPAGLQVYKVKK